MTRLDEAGHWVNLLFDHETPEIEVRSAYTHPALSVRVKTPGPLFVRLPPWCDPESVTVTGADDTPRFTNGYLFLPSPPVNRPITFAYDLAASEVVLRHLTRDIRVRFRGDAVEAMEDHGADLTFFRAAVAGPPHSLDPREDPSCNPTQGERWFSPADLPQRCGMV